MKRQNKQTLCFIEVICTRTKLVLERDSIFQKPIAARSNIATITPATSGHRLSGSTRRPKCTTRVAVVELRVTATNVQ